MPEKCNAGNCPVNARDERRVQVLVLRVRALSVCPLNCTIITYF